MPTATKLLTTTETLALLNRAVAEKGEDYRYPKGFAPFSTDDNLCLYRRTDTLQPACIVGHVLSYLDVLDEAEEGTAADDLGVVRSLFDSRSQNLLTYVQNHQDEGITWGEAVERSRPRSFDA